MALPEERSRDWHRLFGLILTDFFTDSPFVVDVERDLSEQQQILDILIVRKEGGEFAGRLPDGFGGLVDHNLVTFKSHREALDAWAMQELTGHYVAYRKFVSRTPSDLLPEAGFGLYAVCARFPHNLSQQVPWREMGPGVYDCTWGTAVVRVVVARLLPREEQNVPLHLISGSQDLVDFGRARHRRRSGKTSKLLDQLLNLYGEDNAMSYTMEDFQRDYAKNRFKDLTPREQAEALRRVGADKLSEALQGVPLEVRLAGLAPEDLLAALPLEQIKQYLNRQTEEAAPKKRAPRRKKT